MIVVNTTVLSNLARVEKLRLLKLLGDVLVPLPVYEEVLRGREAGYTFLEAVEEFLAEAGRDNRRCRSDQAVGNL